MRRNVGIIGDMRPEIRVQALARDRFVGVVRRGNPLASGKVTLQQLVEHAHRGVSRLGKIWGPIVEALKNKGLARTTAAVAVTATATAALGPRHDDSMETSLRPRYSPKTSTSSRIQSCRKKMPSAFM
ncbi:hypothetical protein WME76_12150 [Sorangium sp. So ce119]|uniref:hypothetical protein n=1 Tax=Sorangium sp. So ce119 TaxID=3133279 RepID=UPI000795E586|nr:hypothetical protein BE11_37615 [Sorangium cellulosum]